jgi:hypothetical protein
VGGAPALLSARRALALGALLAALVLYDAGAGHLPDLSESWDTALVAIVLLPSFMGVLWLSLPLARAGLVVLAGLGLTLAAVGLLLYAVGAESAFNATKVLTFTFAGFAFLALFQELSWVVLVAALIPWIDAFSVWRGPTKEVVTKHPGLFDQISIAFRLPGESGSANLGPPDILFFALFLATAQRFQLRVGWTWITTTALLGLTIALTTTFDVAGLPALPAISLGFLLPNADLLLARLREHRRGR